MTTADYLESLQDDLDRTVTALDLEEGTNFTDIADMAENGDIGTGGSADLSEYFVTTITQVPSSQFGLVKKVPDVTIDNSLTNLSGLFVRYTNPSPDIHKLPKVLCGNNVTNMYSMYSSSSDSTITEIDVSGLNTSNVTSMSRMFSGRRALTSIDLSTFNFEKVQSLTYMFDGCQALTNIDLSNFTGKSFQTNAYGLSYAFNGCSNLIKIDLSNFEPTNKFEVNNAFQNCSKLEELYLDKWDIANNGLTSFANMFSNCGSSLTNGAVTKVYVKDVDAQNWVLTASNGHPSTWTTDNVIIAGSEADLRNA